MSLESTVLTLYESEYTAFKNICEVDIISLKVAPTQPLTKSWLDLT